MRYFTILFFIIISTNLYPEIWVEKNHTDFTDGWEYYYIDGDTTVYWNNSKLRKWNLGSVIYSPASGGFRIIEKDWDLDDNGWLDVGLTSQGQSEIDIYWNGITGFNISNKTTLSGLSSNPQGISFVDINADGYEDIIVGSFSPSKIHIFHGSFSGYSFTPNDSILINAPEVQHPYPTDINNDGYIDLVIGAQHKIYIYYGPGPFYGKIPTDSIIFGGEVATRITVTDLNYDGYLDISASSSTNVGPLCIYFGPNFTSSYILASSHNWDHSIADLNKDGYLDIYINHLGTTDIIYWGSAIGFNVSTLIAGNHAGNCSIEDINGDGELDIASTQCGIDSGYILLGPNYTSHISLPTGSVSHGVEVADFDNDGDKDVLFAARNGQSYLYWNNSVFSSTDRFAFPNACDDAVFEDLGNLWNRSNEERYLSNIFDVQDTTRVDSVKWWGNFPTGIDIEVWARGTKDTSFWNPWVMLSNGGTDITLSETSYLQYRCIISTDYKSTSLFSFDSIKFYYDTLPASVSLEPDVYGFFDVRNCKNPSRGKTNFNFSLPEAGRVNLTIYNLAGKKIKSLITSKHYSQGSHTDFWDTTNEFGKKVSAGIYIYTLEFIGESKNKIKITKKLIMF